MENWTGREGGERLVPAFEIIDCLSVVPSTMHSSYCTITESRGVADQACRECSSGTICCQHLVPLRGSAVSAPKFGVNLFVFDQMDL